MDAPAGIRPDHVAVYIRWSTDEQSSGTTLDVQREACLHYLRSQGWQSNDGLVFIDDGWSGASLARPALSRLREAVAGGGVDCVVVYKIDRLSRNIVDATALVLREWAGACHLKSVREPIDTTVDLGRMIFGILAMFADFERTAIRDRTQTGKLRRLREGAQMHGAPPLGYRRHPALRGRWVADPVEAPFVRDLFAAAAAGESAAAIVRRLNAAGLRTRTGAPWSLRAVTWILHNRTYLGEIVYGRTRRQTGDGGAVARVRRDRPVVAAPTRAAPALVDRDVFEAASRRLEERRAVRAEAGSRGSGSPHLLVGLARCFCGAGLVYRGPGRRGSRHPGYYACAGRAAGRCPDSAPFPAAAAEAVVEDAFRRAFALEGPQPDLEASVRAAATLATSDLRAAARAAELGVRRAARQGTDAHAEARAMAAAAQARLHAAERAVEETARQSGRSPGEVWRSLSPQVRRDLMRAGGGPVVVARRRGDRTVDVSVPWGAAPA